MAKKTFFTIGFELPGDDFEYIPFDSNQSLLDADIILYEVGFGEHYPSETYQGDDQFDHKSSSCLAKSLPHWRSELAAATNAGKLVIVFLAKPLKYFRYTGDVEFSGTGRSRVKTNIVAPVESYSAIPNITLIEPKSGRGVLLTKEASYLKPYWEAFAAYSPFEAFIDGNFNHPLLKTKTGNKIVAAAVQSTGALLFLPPLRYDDDKFVKRDSGKNEEYWTPEALKFGKRLTSTLLSLSTGILSGRIITPPPPWVLDPVYISPEESLFHSKIAEISKKIGKLQQQRTEADEGLNKAGSIRAHALRARQAT